MVVISHILFGDEASGEQRNTHRFEISGTGPSEIDFWSLTCRNLASFDRQESRDVIQCAHQWQTSHETNRRNFRSGPEICLQLLHERNSLLRLLVTRIW